MMKRTVQQVVEMIPGSVLVHGDGTVGVCGVSTNTREISAGQLFVPIVGEKFNAHLYVQQAVDGGAAAVLWQRGQTPMPHDIPVIEVDDTIVAMQQLASSYLEQLNIHIVAITGSNGKTTSKDMVSAVLAEKYNVHKTPGNFNNHIGLPLTVFQLDEAHEAVVLEMGMSGFGEIRTLTNIARPHVALITNIGESHMQDLGSREGISRAKFEIVEGLRSDGLYIYGGDEPLLRDRLAEMEPTFATMSIGAGDDNDLTYRDIVQGDSGTTFTTNDGQTWAIPVLGQHNVHNAVLAIVTGRKFGLTDDEIRRGLANLQLTAMRMEKVVGANGVTWINDAYNASPTSMKAALRMLGELGGFTRKVAVLGDMLELGDNEMAFHREVGEAAFVADVLFTFGERSKATAEAAQVKEVYSFVDKAELIDAVRAFVAKGDVVLVKASRGMRLEEVII